MSEFICISGRKVTIHKAAYCQNCDWSNCDYKDKNITQKIKRHVEKTGHEVGYETGTSQTFQGG